MAANIHHFPIAMQFLGVSVQMGITNSEVAEDQYEDLSNLFIEAVAAIPGGAADVVAAFHAESGTTWDIIEANRAPLPGFHLIAPPPIAPFHPVDFECKLDDSARGG